MTNTEARESKVLIKKGRELTSDELLQMKATIWREFKVPFGSEDQLNNRLFFLLKDVDQILAMGALWEVTPVIFNGEQFTIHGVLNVVANERGKGYGKQVVTSIRNYLLNKKITGLGFCMPKNRGFYEKCGFTVTDNTTSRFVHLADNQKITNQDGQIIFYQDGSDRFMEKILGHPIKQVILPTMQLW